jgi:hypothetical protein
MAQKIRITAGPVTVDAELNDTQTAQAICDDLPITARGNRWGDEIYFSISSSGQLENGNDLVEVGDLAFWPPGNAFCIFWGPTPASHGSEPRAASAVTVVGKVIEDAKVFGQVSSGAEIVIEKAD